MNITYFTRFTFHNDVRKLPDGVHSFDEQTFEHLLRIGRKTQRPEQGTAVAGHRLEIEGIGDFPEYPRLPRTRKPVEHVQRWRDIERFDAPAIYCRSRHTSVSYPEVRASRQRASVSTPPPRKHPMMSLSMREIF